MTRQPSRRLQRGVALALCLFAAPLFSCFAPQSVTCKSGLVCPPGEQCAITQDTCIRTDCGDGTLQPGEVCDDGNVEDGDGCNHDCTSNEACGNGILDSKQGEVCDDGNTRSGDGCSADCHSTELCGNGYVDTVKGEVCDDGNTANGDGCSADCRSNETCGNGRLDTAVGELCDDGNNVSGDGCSADCRSGESCGNHIRDDSEECDDGNSSDTDNCVHCKLARCGDGVVDLELPDVEECDYAATPDTCNYNCKVNTCGDGIVNAAAGEECDNGSGNSDSGDCLPVTCKLARCGDGKVDAAPGPHHEQCDSAATPKTCNKDCTPSACGDGLVNAAAGETCDLGVTSDKPTCNFNCTIAVCGDGYANAAAGEECDDGNRNTCGTCDLACQIVALSSGSITAIDASSLKDGETFAIGDGRGSLTFQFLKTTTPPVTTNELIQLTSTDKAPKVATAIAVAIADNLELDTAVSPTDPATVVITNRKLGANTFRITKTVQNSGFKVSGMAGGDPAGSGCKAGIGCQRDQDCAPGLQCTAHLCAQ